MVHIDINRGTFTRIEIHLTRIATIHQSRIGMALYFTRLRIWITYRERDLHRLNRHDTLFSIIIIILFSLRHNKTIERFTFGTRFSIISTRSLP